jgi:hypothetical protein
MNDVVDLGDMNVDPQGNLSVDDDGRNGIWLDFTEMQVDSQGHLWGYDENYRYRAWTFNGYGDLQPVDDVEEELEYLMWLESEYGYEEGDDISESEGNDVPF